MVEYKMTVEDYAPVEGRLELVTITGTDFRVKYFDEYLTLSRQRRLTILEVGEQKVDARSWPLTPYWIPDDAVRVTDQSGLVFTVAQPQARLDAAGALHPDWDEEAFRAAVRVLVTEDTSPGPKQIEFNPGRDCASIETITVESHRG